MDDVSMNWRRRWRRRLSLLAQEDHLKMKNESEEARTELEVKLSALEAEKLEWEAQRETREQAQGDAELKADELEVLEAQARAELETAQSELESTKKSLKKAEKQASVWFLKRSCACCV